MFVQDIDLSIRICKIPAGFDSSKSVSCLKIPPHRHCAQVTLKNKARGKRKEQRKKSGKQIWQRLLHSLFFFSCGLRAGFASALLGRLGIWDGCGN